MQLHIKFYAELKEKFQTASDTFELEESSSLSELWRQINQKYLDAEEQIYPFENVLVAVNHNYVDKDYLPQNGDLIVFVPPVSGG